MSEHQPEKNGGFERVIHAFLSLIVPAQPLIFTAPPIKVYYLHPNIHEAYSWIPPKTS